MSNAVTTLTATAAIVPSDFNSSKLGNQQVATNNSNNNNKIESLSTTDNTVFVSSSSNLTNTPPNSISSSSSSETSSLTGDMNTNTNNNTTTVNTNANINGATNLNINSYYHPNQHHQYHNPHLNFNHLHHQPHIQYIQFSNASSPNQATTPSMNGSPLASLTSSPTTTNGSFSYHNPQHHPHLLNHHSIQNNLIHHHHPQQQQQFQQLQQFHSFHSNYKDTRWLTLEVCREFQRNKCNRNETECKFAHPPAHVEIINGKVIACYDSLKGKCTRKEPPCKYLHPPQHLKDQLLQNGKNNLVLRQVALAMMHQQQQQQTNPQAPQTATAALLAAAAAASGSNTTPTNNSVGQFTQFTTSPNGATNSTQTNTNSTNVTSNATQFIPTALTNGGLTTYSQVQLATNGSGAQPTLLPMLANGFHHPSHHPHQLQHMQQAIYATTSDPTTLLQVSAVSPGAAAASANGLLPPQQRTDRLQGDLNDAANGSTTFTLENGQTFQIPQYQIYTPIYQRAPNANSTNEELNQQQADLNKATNASATATATVANMVDVVPNKKRQHDAIDQDFIPMSATNLYQTTTMPVKRTALTDSKTGMPMFQPFTQNLSNQATTIHHLQHHAQGQPITITQHPAGAQAVTALNYPINFATMQYAPYPPTFSLPYNGHPAGLPRL